METHVIIAEPAVSKRVVEQGAAPMGAVAEAGRNRPQATYDIDTEEGQRALMKKIKDNSSWKETENYLIRRYSLRYAKYISSLDLPESTKDEVHKLILDSYLPHTQKELREIEGELRETLGDSNYSALRDYKNEIRQRAVDDEMSADYGRARPSATPEEIGAVSQVIVQIDVAKETNAILNQDTPVTTDQITALMTRYDNSFAAAVQNNPPLDPQALAALKAVFEQHMRDDLRKALEWRRDHPGKK